MALKTEISSKIEMKKLGTALAHYLASTDYSLNLLSITFKISKLFETKIRCKHEMKL